MLCRKCYDDTNNAYSLKIKCLNTENKLKNFKSCEGLENFKDVNIGMVKVEINDPINFVPIDVKSEPLDEVYVKDEMSEINFDFWENESQEFRSTRSKKRAIS